MRERVEPLDADDIAWNGSRARSSVAPDVMLSVGPPAASQAELLPFPSRDLTPERERDLCDTLTDAGNADRFALRECGRLVFDHRRGAWMVWTGERWREDIDGEAQRRAIESARALQRGALDIRDSEAKRRVSAFAMKSEDVSRLRATLELGRVHTHLADDGTHWNADPWLLGVPNGVIDLHDGRIREARPDDRISYSAGVAFEDGAECPRWERFVSEIVGGDGELAAFLKRAVGYSLTADTREQVVFLCHGSGANGKSTFLETVASVFGDYAKNAPFSTFELSARSGMSNDVATLDGARLITASETNDGSRLNEARIKSLTGGDAITARFLHREFFTFRPVGKFWLAFNHKPRVADDSIGFWRRVRLIPFEQSFAGARGDRQLRDVLRAEASGILRWSIDGCLDWQAHGLDAPAAVEKATQSYRDESDPLSGFLDECCVVLSDATVRASNAFAAYRAYADRAELRGSDRLNQNTFGARMSARFERLDTKRGRIYRGVALKHESAE